MISTKVEAINRDVEILFAEELSPEAKSRTLAAFAGQQIADVERSNSQIIGADAGKTIVVDGRIGAPLETVKPSGVIVAEFNLVGDLIGWIGAQLVTNSPRRSGRYAQSHAMFVDGVQAMRGSEPQDFSEVAFVNLQPYARKIENGLSNQAPDGVYQSVAAVAAKRFGNVARIYFDYRSIVGGSKDKADRQPAVIVRVG